MANLIVNSYPTWSEWFTPTSAQNEKRSLGTIIIPALDKNLEVGLCAGFEIEFKDVAAVSGATFDIQTYNTLEKINVPWSANLLNLDYAPKNGVYTFAYLFELDDTIQSGDSFGFGISTSGWQSGQYRVRNLFTTKELVKYEPPTVDDFVTSVNGRTGDVTVQDLLQGKKGQIVGFVNDNEVGAIDDIQVSLPEHLVITESDGEITEDIVKINADTLENHSANYFATAEIVEKKQDKLPFDIFSIPEMHRNIFRGKNLGSVFTDEQKAMIAAGTFDDLYIGDYWTMNGRTWRIADFDYWYRTGKSTDLCIKHHVVVVPDTILYKAAMMGPPNSIEGGYLASDMWTKNLDQAKEIVETDFGVDSILYHWEYLSNATQNGYVTGNILVNCGVNLMTQIMVAGSNIGGSMSSGDSALVDNSTVSIHQIKLFQIAPVYIRIQRYPYWLRDIVKTASYAIVADNGSVITLGSGWDSPGVRPAVGIIGV